MILEKFAHSTGIIDINLDNDYEDGRLVMYMTYEGGGRVDGFIYAVDNVWGIKEEEAAKLDVIKHMALTLEHNLLSDAWENFTSSSGNISCADEP